MCLSSLNLQLSRSSLKCANTGSSAAPCAGSPDSTLAGGAGSAKAGALTNRPSASNPPRIVMARSARRPRPAAPASTARRGSPRSRRSHPRSSACSGSWSRRTRAPWSPPPSPPDRSHRGCRARDHRSAWPRALPARARARTAPSSSPGSSPGSRLSTSTQVVPWFSRRLAGARALLLDELGEVRDRAKRVAGLLILGDLDVVLARDRRGELQRVDRIEVEPRAEQRLGIRDRGWIDVLELERVDHELLDLLMQS